MRVERPHHAMRVNGRIHAMRVNGRIHAMRVNGRIHAMRVNDRYLWDETTAGSGATGLALSSPVSGRN
jgi:hypothetical protein